MIHQEDSQAQFVVFTIEIYSSRLQSKISTGKTFMEWSSEEIRHNILRVLSQWNGPGCAQFFSHELWQHDDVFLSWETRNSVPKVFWMAGHVGTHFLMPISDSQKEHRGV